MTKKWSPNVVPHSGAGFDGGKLSVSRRNDILTCFVDDTVGNSTVVLIYFYLGISVVCKIIAP